MKYKEILSITFVFFFLLGFISCEKTDPDEQLCDPTPKFNIDLFIQNVIAELDEVAGYQLVVNKDGNLYFSDGDGFSIYAIDPNGPIAMTEITRMNVASVSKFIGTIALMQVLEKHNISIEQPIHTYLPERWKISTHTDHYEFGSQYLVRFRNMLRMETAIPFPGDSWTPGRMPSTQEMMDGLSLPAAPNRWGVYQNGNFTLIRVLIGEIEYGLDETAADYNDVVADKYFEYIKANIFHKLNINPPMSVNEVDNYYQGSFTRAHQWPFDDSYRDTDNYVGWGATSSPVNNGGSGGLVLSAMDLAKVLAFFQHDQNGTIISTTQRDLILQHELGLTESLNGEHGTYQSKGGTRGPENVTSRALRSRIVFYPDGMEAVLLSNSNITMMSTILRESYDHAWVSDCD